MSKDIILISTADWSNPYWTNKQHTAISLSKKGKRILYIDSLGLRGPTVSLTDGKRIIKRYVGPLNINSIIEIKKFIE